MRKLNFQVDGRLCFTMALFLLLLPLQWVLAMFFAIFVHEMFHFLAIHLLGGEVYGLSLRCGGIRMETEPLPPGRELVSAAAGPIGSALLMLLAPWLPRTAICGGIHCLYNLLPIFPMDGGRILRSGIDLCFPGRISQKFYTKLEMVLRLFLVGVVLLAGARWGVVCLIPVIIFLWRRLMDRTV